MTQPAHPAPHLEGLSMLEKRQIEAEILKEVYETLKESHGEAVARRPSPNRCGARPSSRPGSSPRQRRAARR